MNEEALVLKYDLKLVVRLFFGVMSKNCRFALASLIDSITI